MLTTWLSSVRRLSFCQYSVRALLLFAAVVCLVTFFLRREFDHWKNGWIEEGTVIHALTPHIRSSCVESIGPAYLRWLCFGEDCKYLDRVVEIQLLIADDADLARLPSLSAIRDIRIPYSDEITDAGLKRVSEISTLTHLTVGGSLNITSVGLRSLGRLIQLRELNISMPIHDASALAQICERFSRLETLSVSGPVIDDKAVAALKRCRQLRSLRLHSTLASGSGLAELADLPILQDIDLDGYRVSNVGIEKACALPHLRRLSISGDSISDQATVCMEECPGLIELRIHCDNVTDDAIIRLCRSHKALVTLDLSKSARISDAVCDAITKIRSLRELTVSDTQISQNGLSAVASRAPWIAIVP